MNIKHPRHARQSMALIAVASIWFGMISGTHTTGVRAVSGNQVDGAADRPPNIVLILSDDAGYADFGFQGSEVMKTPHLDRFAREGVRCTQVYVTAAVCGPSRAGLMTGRYQQKFGFWQNDVPGAVAKDAGRSGRQMRLPTDQKTIADRLKPLGYRSMALGKWHLGGADRFHPLKRGFDAFYGFRSGARSYWPLKNLEGKGMDRLERGFKHYEEHEGYLTDVLGRAASRFIRKNRDRSFFVYLAFNAVHRPMHATKADLGSFRI